MRKILHIIILSLFCLSAFAKETAYVSTDRKTYVAGDLVYLSVFCFEDNSNSELAKLNRILYTELHGAGGMVAASKVAIMDGRGGGYLEIPITAPSGNYKIISYVKSLKGDVTSDFTQKEITIFNTLSPEKQKGVKIIEEQQTSSSKNSEIPMIGSANQDFSLIFSENFKKNTGFYDFTIKSLNGLSSNVSISVYYEDSLDFVPTSNLSMFLQNNGGKRDLVKNIPEYEGETISGKLYGVEKDKIANYTGTMVYLSIKGAQPEIYSSRLDSLGNVKFVTRGIFGEKEVATLFLSSDTTSKGYVEYDEQFVRRVPSNFTELSYNKSIEKKLIERSLKMQISKRYSLDTLFELLPVRPDPAISTKPFIYILDDYTRFTQMQEVVNEFVSEMRLRREGKIYELQVRWEDSYNSLAFAKGTSLMLIDGIPVFDHNKIIAYDPMKVKELAIYNKSYYLGAANHTGVVNFITYTGNYPDFKFGPNLRIKNFKGISYPVIITDNLSEIIPSNMPDYRQTIYWHPVVKLDRNAEKVIRVKLPDYKGTFRVVVEGISEQGTPVSVTGFFKTE